MNIRFTKTPNTECILCGIGYYERPSRLSRTKFCSKQCFHKSPERYRREKGYKCSPNTIEKLSKRMSSQRGEQTPNWRGGTSKSSKTGYYSPEYKNWRESVFTRDNFTCQGCKQYGGYLESHHIKQFAYYPELRFNMDNGITLCKPCHEQTDNYGHKKKLNKNEF